MSQSSATSEPVGHPLIGTEIGKYRLVRLLGRGGMGSVFEAVHTTIGQRVAVKVLNPALSEEPEILQRFFIEARASSLVKHPGLVQIFDHGTLDHGRAYILMEFLEGVSLRQHLRKDGTLSPQEALLMMRLIASALAAAHDKGIIHRDLKPENIFLVPDPAAPGGVRPKVLDFGIAKLADPADSDSGLRTHTGALLGTPAYMSPEQCRAGHLTTKSDVYSLGIVLYQLLVGQTPFGDTASGEVYARHLYEEPPLLSLSAKAVPPALDELVSAMLSKDPEERPTMAQVEQALTALGAEPTSLSRSMTGLSTGWRWQRRRIRLRAALGRGPVLFGLLVLASVLSGALTLWIWRRAPAPRRVEAQPIVAAPLPPAAPPPGIAPAPRQAAPPPGPAAAQQGAPPRRAPGDPDKASRPRKPKPQVKEEDDLEFQIAR